MIFETITLALGKIINSTTQQNINKTIDEIELLQRPEINNPIFKKAKMNKRETPTPRRNGIKIALLLNISKPIKIKMRTPIKIPSRKAILSKKKLADSFAAITVFLYTELERTCPRVRRSFSPATLL